MTSRAIRIMAGITVAFHLASCAAAHYSREDAAWLEPHPVPRIEWLALFMQFSEGDDSMTDGIRVRFRLGPEAEREGVLTAVIQYAQGTSLIQVDRTEDMILRTFRAYCEPRGWDWGRLRVERQMLGF